MGSGDGEKLLLSFQESPGLCATEKIGFPMPGSSGRLGCLSGLSQAQPTLLCGPEQASGSVWTEAESPVLFLRGLSSKF